jgi:S1-C subfamily serine protease
VLCAAVALLAAGPAAAQTTPSAGTPQQRAAAIAGPAVVYLEQHWRAWVKIPKASELIFFQGYVNGGLPFEWATRCTGFVVNPNGYIVTAGHCVDPGEEGARGDALAMAVAWLVQQGYIYKRDFDYWLNEAHLMWSVEGEEKGSEADLQIYVQRGVAAGGVQSGEALPARLVDVRPLSEGDVALLKVEATDLPTLLLAPTESIAIGTPILSVGYPGSTDQVTDASYEPTFKDGQINAQKTREGGLFPVYEVSASMSGGMSGGPTVNLDGEVVGLNSFGPAGEPQPFNFIAPASIVAEVLARNGVTNELGPVDVTYREGVDAFFAGDYRTALARFEDVLAVAPTHQQAQDLKTQAARLAQQQPATPTEAAGTAAGGGLPTGAVVGIGAAAAILIVGALLLAARRKSARPAPAPQSVPAAPAPTGAEPVSGVGSQPQASQPPVATSVAEPPPQAAAPESAPAAQPRFCAGCGHALQPDARFCPSCGRPVQG